MVPFGEIWCFEMIGDNQSCPWDVKIFSMNKFLFMASTRLRTSMWRQEFHSGLKTRLSGKCLPTFTVSLLWCLCQNLHMRFVAISWFALKALLAERKIESPKLWPSSFHWGAVAHQKNSSVTVASCIMAPPNIYAKEQCQNCCKLRQNRQFWLKATLDLQQYLHMGNKTG